MESKEEKIYTIHSSWNLNMALIALNVKKNTHWCIGTSKDMVCSIHTRMQYMVSL